jgi:predicted SprT family Zn-dependent metalloprotease
MKAAFQGERTERRDVRANGLKTTIRIKPSVWAAFAKTTKQNGTTTQKQINAFRVNNPADELVPAIEAYLADNKTTVYNFATREHWLNATVDAMRPVFNSRGFPLPDKIRVSVGFTSKGARGKRIGECWSSTMSKDAHVEIFLDPIKNATPLDLLNVLTHELVHAWQAGEGRKLGHRKDFKRCGEAMNLEGKAASMAGGNAWKVWAQPILEALGPCNYGALLSAPLEKKKQTTRMVKCECPVCGFTFRTTAKWLEGKSYLTCPDDACRETITVDKEDGNEDTDEE